MDADAKDRLNVTNRYVYLHMINSYVDKTKKLLQTCVDLEKPGSSIGYRIRLGLLVRIVKLHKSIIDSYECDNDLATQILLRSMSETCLSLSYLLSSDDVNYDEFVLTDAMWRRETILMMDVIDNIKIDGKKVQKFGLQKTLRQSIKDDGLVYKDIPRGRPRGGSWHTTKTYYDMAKSLGQVHDAMFKMTYSTGSNATHPNWSDIKINHITESDNDSSLYVKNMSDTIKTENHLSILTCMIYEVTGRYMAIYGDTEQAQAVSVDHGMFHHDAITKHYSLSA